MKRLFKTGLMAAAAFGASMAFTGCSEEEATAPVVQENEQPDGITTTKFYFSVHVVPATDGGKTAGLAGASVTVSQNGIAQTTSTNEDGIAKFENLLEGEVSYYVKADGYARMNGVAPLSASKPDRDRDHTVMISESAEVLLPKMAGKLRGNAVWNADADDDTPMTAVSGAPVRFELSNKMIQPNVFYTTTGTDGKWQMTGVPAGVTGTVSVDTVLTLTDGQIVTFTGSYATTSATLGDFKDLGEKEIAKETGTAVKYTGEVVALFWGELDGAEPETPTATYSAISAGVMPKGNAAWVTEPYLMVDAAGYPKTLKNKFEGTYNATTQKWSFAGLPIGYNMKFVLAAKSEINIAKANGNECLVIGTTQDKAPTQHSGFPGAECATGATLVDRYTKTLFFDSVSSNATVTLNSDKEVKDLGFIQVVE